MKIRLPFLLITTMSFTLKLYSQGVIVPTNATQADFLKAYKLALDCADKNFRLNDGGDSVLFPQGGEYSVYLAKTGGNKGSFIIADTVSAAYSSVTANPYGLYNWSGAEHAAIQFKRTEKPVAIFQSQLKQNNVSITWEALYFRDIFNTWLFDDMYSIISETTLDTSFLPSTTKLLIIPAFSINGTNNKFYIDSLVNSDPNIKTKLDSFLVHGGNIYTEGNAVYFLEKLGYLNSGAVDFTQTINPDPNTNLCAINVVSPSSPVSFAADACANSLYAFPVPKVNCGSAEVVATFTTGDPAVFVLKGSQALGGKIICNLGIPTAGGINNVLQGSKQLEWSLDAVLYAFTNSIDVTRSIYNNLPSGIIAGQNAVAYDKVDTFEVRVKVRNLSSTAVSNLTIEENIQPYFSFVDVLSSGASYTINGNKLVFTGINAGPQSETVIVYRLQTPPISSTIHEHIDNYLEWSTYLLTATSLVNYSDNEGNHLYDQIHAYADMMFSADIRADADLNWKNFLGIFYQPFKVFTIMENKERTAALQTQYVHYIPKDVPFYWVDHSLNIPVLKTPGGKFIDVLHGSDSQSAPSYDMSNNGHPDVWLDTASIYPKGYTIVEDSVLWQNPWHKLITGDTIAYYEDVNHNGINGDAGDKIAVWKVTWNIDTMPGLQVFDPYASYEIWVDPPDLVGMAEGVSYVNGVLSQQMQGMFYPYSPNINSPNLSDTSWTYWMDRDTTTGQIKYTQLIYQHQNNYEGYTFIDTAATHYQLLPTDSLVGTVPQPHNEFIAVLSLGGEEIDMNNPTPSRSNYSNISYKTIFNESKNTPLRTTYTYYAPLPNPLQFEYLTNSYSITDTLGHPLKKFPERGKAEITYDVQASTEYSYYWIRNAGHDVDFNDPSLAAEGVDGMGDGVFGYMIYDIPKGLGGYKISLPKLSNGAYDINSIVQVDGHLYQPWITNPNTLDSISIWEDDFKYHIHIPQLLIPPALCDKNHDGIDDWIDDRGDRFHSQTGYLHDAYMQGDGEQYPAGSPNVYAHVDSGMAGLVTEGWSSGADNTYGSDDFDKLGKVHFTIHADYEGFGKEGPVDISHGGWLVVEEIFGGSPWAIFSHNLSGYAEGVDIKVTPTANPSLVKFGVDTGWIKHRIEDLNEPHHFDDKFDPYQVSSGEGDVSITTYAGGKDPCSLTLPANTFHTIIDPAEDHTSMTLIPLADGSNPDLAGYPRVVNGTFIEAMISVVNGTEDNWVNTTITPVFSGLGNTHVEMQYVCYPRPLVPAVADPSTGLVTHSGDQIGTFTTGWRFNQPDGEVIVKMGPTLNLIQPTRRAYFLVLISIDESLPRGVYDIGFTVSGQRYDYMGANHGAISFDVPDLKFSVTSKTGQLDYEKLVIGNAALQNLHVNTTPTFKGLQNVKWSLNDVNYTDFSSMTNSLSSSYDSVANSEDIDMTLFSKFPSVDTLQVFVLQEGQINTYKDAEGNPVDISTTECLGYDYDGLNYSTCGGHTQVTPSGPRIILSKTMYRINGELVSDSSVFNYRQGPSLDVEVLIATFNAGSDIATNTILNIKSGQWFDIVIDSLPANCTYNNGVVTANMTSYLPGERRELYLHYKLNQDVCLASFNIADIISSIAVSYNGQPVTTNFRYSDNDPLIFPASDLRVTKIESDKDKGEPGSDLNVSVTATNGPLAVSNVWLRVYSISSATSAMPDTVLAAEKFYSSLSAFQQTTFNFTYTVEDDANLITLYAKVDESNTVCEICENNNDNLKRIPVKGGLWIDHVTTTPNPFTDAAAFYYELGRDMNEVHIDVYTAEGKIISHIANCPAVMGAQKVNWQSPTLASASYYYKITGIDVEGKSYDYAGKLMKN